MSCSNLASALLLVLFASATLLLNHPPGPVDRRRALEDGGKIAYDASDGEAFTRVVEYFECPDSSQLGDASIPVVLLAPPDRTGRAYLRDCRAYADLGLHLFAVTLPGFGFSDSTPPKSVKTRFDRVALGLIQSLRVAEPRLTRDDLVLVGIRETTAHVLSLESTAIRGYVLIDPVWSVDSMGSWFSWRNWPYAQELIRFGRVAMDMRERGLLAEFAKSTLSRVALSRRSQEEEEDDGFRAVQHTWRGGLETHRSLRGWTPEVGKAKLSRLGDRVKIYDELSTGMRAVRDAFPIRAAAEANCTAGR